MLADIALALLKLVSSHRGLTYVPPFDAQILLLTRKHRHDIFDDQMRKQFSNKSPNYNPFGTTDAPLKFNDFDIFTKVGSFLYTLRG